MTDRTKELKAQLIAKEQQLQDALQEVERIRAHETETVEIIGDLIARMVHDINNMNTRIHSSSQSLSHAFHDLQQHLPTLFFQFPPEQQKDFLALVDRSLHSQQQLSQRLSSREERRLRRSLMKELEAHELEHVDEIADILVDMGVYQDIQPFLSLLKGKHRESVLQAAYSLISIQDVNQWNLQPAYDRIMRITHTLRHSIIALLANQMTTDKITRGIDDVLTVYQHLFDTQQIEVMKHYEEIPIISCYPGLDLVWMNLIENAVEAIEQDGTLEIAVSKRQNETVGQGCVPTEEYILVSITDSGRGIPDEIRDKIFEHSVTTKTRKAVHGAGLYIVRRIIDKHQGSIDVESQPGKTTFRVWLPIITP